jgi:hypothetical protein
VVLVLLGAVLLVLEGAVVPAGAVLLVPLLLDVELLVLSLLVLPLLVLPLLVLPLLVLPLLVLPLLVLEGAGQSIQKVLCFWGSCEKSSLK